MTQCQRGSHDQNDAGYGSAGQFLKTCGMPIRKKTCVTPKETDGNILLTSGQVDRLTRLFNKQ